MGWGIINPNLSQLHRQTQGHREGTYQNLLTLKGHGGLQRNRGGRSRINDCGGYMQGWGLDSYITNKK